MSPRAFASSEAVRSHVPLLIALIGPSGGGKTFSALRLATGIQRVQPGPIDVIDTEAMRATAYAPKRGEAVNPAAGKFGFRHVPFEAPFGSLDYLAAFQHCVSGGARTVIVDSMSHEHEGVGGLLDQAEEFIQRALKRKNIDPDSDAGWAEEQKFKRSAWIEPKRGRTKLIQTMVQMPCNFILCFRAKEGTDQVRDGGKTKIVKLGWIPIGGDAFWYEMTARALLPPGANGVPEWDVGKLEKGEKIAVRRPRQFESILKGQLSEDMGEAMARWATGESLEPQGGTPVMGLGGKRVAVTQGPPEPVTFELAIDLLNETKTVDGLRALAANLRRGSWDAEQRAQIAKTISDRQSALKEGK